MKCTWPLSSCLHSSRICRSHDNDGFHQRWHSTHYIAICMRCFLAQPNQLLLTDEVEEKCVYKLTFKMLASDSVAIFFSCNDFLCAIEERSVEVGFLRTDFNCSYASPEVWAFSIHVSLPRSFIKTFPLCGEFERKSYDSWNFIGGTWVLEAFFRHLFFEPSCVSMSQKKRQIRGCLWVGAENCGLR